MKSISVAEAAGKSNPHGVEAKTIYDHDHAAISHLMLQPGQELKKHVTPVDVAFYVIDGEVEVEIGEEKETFGKDTMIESPKGIPHLLRNVGSVPMRILVMKLPRPTEKSVLM